jgi:hypothetical protein
VLRFGTDENFNGRIRVGLLRAWPDLDLVRAQDAGLSGAPDEEVLAWAAAESRVLLTGDRRTLVGLAYERVRRGLSMPGLIVVHTNAQVGSTVNDILMLAVASRPGEWEGQVIYLPL